MEKKTITYKDAGVDIDAGAESVELNKPVVQRFSVASAVLVAFLLSTKTSTKSQSL